MSDPRAALPSDLPSDWDPDVVRRHQRPLMHLAGRWTSPPMLRRPADLRHAVDGRVVVITGASSGVGAALARQCAAAGAEVVICARSRDLLNEVARGIRADGGRVDVHVVDLADEDGVREFARAVLAEHGRVDVLVHNAGKSMNRSVARSALRPKDLTSTLNANYLGPARLTMALLPYMRACGSGHVVNVSTIGLLLPPIPRWGLYLGSKAAFDWWLRCVAAEVAADGVDVSCHYLGSARTKMSAADNVLTRLPSQSAEDAARGVARTIVTRRRSVAWRPAFGIGALTTVVRGPIEGLAHRAYARVPETSAAAAHGLPEVDLVFGDPDLLAQQRD